MAMEHHIPIIVFNIRNRGDIARILSGQKVGTVIAGEDDEG
jgi:uridylate kinase